jgi:hypothetical protein
MTRTLAALASLPILLSACGSARSVSAPAASLPSSTDAPSQEAAALVSHSTGLAGLPLRTPGDFVVFRFSGKLKQHPMTLTERLVAQQVDTTTIDYTLEDGPSSRRTMRVRSIGSGAEQKIASVALMDGEVEGPLPTAAFDKFLSKTFVTTDDNGGAIASEKATLDVNGQPIFCTKTSYKVTIDKKAATMTVLESEGFAWGDVGGEIRGADGTLLYKAELVTQGKVSTPAVVALTSP